MRSRSAAVLLAIAALLFFFWDPLALAMLRHQPAPRPNPSEPIQTDADRPPFEHRVGGRTYRVTPRFRFDQSARVLSSRAYRWGADGALLPEDLALAWGPVLEAPYVGKVSYSQFSRFFFWRTKDPSLDRGTIVTHTANVHIVPRTIRLKRAVRAVDSGDLVRLQGFLVDLDGVDDSDFHWSTSVTRDDEGPASCETIFLERLTVGERAYE